MFIILAWRSPENVSLVLGEDGKARLFRDHQEAESFAERELTANWKIIEL